MKQEPLPQIYHVKDTDIPRFAYAGLLEQKRKAYAAYKQVRSDMRELQNVKANVDYLLDIPAGRETQPDIQKSR